MKKGLLLLSLFILPVQNVLAVDFVQETSEPFSMLRHVQSHPSNAVDFDGDGDYDFFVADSSGQLRYYENNDDTDLDFTDLEGSFIITDNFGGIDVGSSGSVFVLDWDGNGDYDFLMGNEDGDILIYENFDGEFSVTAVTYHLDDDTEFKYTKPVVYWDGPDTAFVDYLLVGYEGGVRYLQNDGSDEFDDGGEFSSATTDIANFPFVVHNADNEVELVLMGVSSGVIEAYDTDGVVSIDELGAIDVGDFSAPTVFDWDDNTTLDLIVGNREGDLSYFDYNGDGTFDFVNPTTVLDAGDFSSPTAVDWDGENGLDLIVGAGDGKLYLYLNNGDDTFADRTTIKNGLINDVTVGSKSAPVAVLWNDDANYDLVIGNDAGEVTLYLNDGDGGFIIQNLPTPDSDLADSIATLTYARPNVLDWDGNGFWDILMTYNDSGTAYFDLYLNDETDSFAHFTIGAITQEFVVANAADWTGDGFIDILVGSDDRSLTLYENTSGSNDPATLAFDTITENFGGINVGNYTSFNLVDWNDDGDNDILIGNYSGQVGLFYQDSDGNGVEPSDNCPSVSNPSQADSDDDGIGDACDTSDGDDDDDDDDDGSGSGDDDDDDTTVVCGDSAVGTGEECDDGNTTDGDGCSALCLDETASGDDDDASEGAAESSTGCSLTTTSANSTAPVVAGLTSLAFALLLRKRLFLS